MAVFRVERTRDYTVMSNHHLKNRSLSLKAKGLLSVMLSLPDEWDYTLRGLAAISREGVDAIREAIRELEDAGYIVRSRGRNEKGQLSGTEYVIYEHPQQSADVPVLDNPTQEKSVVADEPKRESKSIKPLDFSTSKALSEPCKTSGGSGKTPMWENPTLENPTLEKPTLEKPTLENPTQLNTKRSKTNSERKQQTNSSIHLSIPSPSLPAQTEGGMEEDQVRKYRNQVKRNIDYFEISEDYAANLEQLDEIVDLMVETLCSTRPTLSVAGDNLPASLVKERLLKINCMHIQYVMDSLKSNTTPVRNIKRYLLTVLFNAPATIDHYYSAQFRHEYYQQAQRSRAEGYGSMQEDIENRAVALAIKSVKLTGHGLKVAIAKYLAHRKEQKLRTAPIGRQTVKQLMRQGQSVSNIEITDGNIKSFQRVARKYSVNYALKKDTSGEIPKYLVFFKAKDADALTAAFQEYAAREIRREKKPTIQERLYRAQVKRKTRERAESQGPPKCRRDNPPSMSRTSKRQEPLVTPAFFIPILLQGVSV